jgi:hypothetical protein
MFESFIQLQQFAPTDFERMFFRLILRSHFVIEIGSAGLFDVATEQVGHDFAFGETNHPLRTRYERGKIFDVQTVWPQAVAGEQNARLMVIEAKGGIVNTLSAGRRRRL